MPAAAIDLEHRIIPDMINLPGAVAVYVVSVAVQPDRWLELLLGGLGCFLFFFVAHMVSPKGMGMGDVKMALMIGLGLGQHAFFALFAAFLASTVLSMFLLDDARPQGPQDLRAVRPVPRVRRRRRPDLGRRHLADPDRRVAPGAALRLAPSRMR